MCIALTLPQAANSPGALICRIQKMRCPSTVFERSSQRGRCIASASFSANVLLLLIIINNTLCATQIQTENVRGSHPRYHSTYSRSATHNHHDQDRGSLRPCTCLYGMDNTVAHQRRRKLRQPWHKLPPDAKRPTGADLRQHTASVTLVWTICSIFRMTR